MNNSTYTGNKTSRNQIFVYTFQELGEWYATVHKSDGKRVYKSPFVNASLTARDLACDYMELDQAGKLEILETMLENNVITLPEYAEFVAGWEDDSREM